MVDPERAACACVGTEAAHGAAVTVPAVRDLALRRRRSRIPWMYRVYHGTRQAPDRPGRRGHRGTGAVALADRGTGAVTARGPYGAPTPA